MTARPRRLKEVEVITFDCYGTLIDWESGAKGTLRALAAMKDIQGDLDPFFQAWERAQRARIEGPYAPYREIAAECFVQVARAQQLPFEASDGATFADSIATWKPFPDTPLALQALKRQVRLGIISNIDDDILADSVKLMGAEFDLLMTAQQARAYKPSAQPFVRALERLARLPARIAHAAFGFEYDIITASALGFRTILVQRGRTDFPATPVPDLVVDDLSALAMQFA
ncbi:MAG: haloacid dehalogenase type II [Candidatus Acidiferrales bacterium]